MVRRDCSLAGEEGGDDARSACPSDTLGCTHNTMVGTKGCKTARWSKSPKPSSVRIEVCNRPHEAGIASNPGSAKPGSIRSRVLYSPPVKSGELVVPETLPCAELR